MSPQRSARCNAGTLIAPGTRRKHQVFVPLLLGPRVAGTERVLAGQDRNFLRETMRQVKSNYGLNSLSLTPVLCETDVNTISRDFEPSIAQPSIRRSILNGVGVPSTSRKSEKR